MPDNEDLRLRLYHQLASEGRVPTRSAVARELHLSDEAVATAYAELAAARHLALDDDGEIVLAHPFATRDFGFSVKSHDVLWWGGCAWDSFAIPHLVPGASPSLVATTCPACDTAHAWNVTATAAPTGTQVVHFLVPMHDVWDDVVHACENKLVFCDEDCVDTWLERTGKQKGAVFGLHELWDLASEWYGGRLQRGYRRKDPAAAASSFHAAGLRGPFWGD